MSDRQARLRGGRAARGWLCDFREDLTLYGAMMQVIEFAQTVVKQTGFRAGISCGA